tara:strand:- start:14622 stop:14768 length:147 start_codon:yes stop_codon:yes gene_type:complete
VEFKAWMILSAGILLFYGLAILSGNFPPDKEITEECRQMALAMTKICP